MNGEKIEMARLNLPNGYESERPGPLWCRR